MITWADFDVGRHRISCPNCGRGERDRTFSLTIDAEGNGVCHCFRCDFTESYRPISGARVSKTSNPLVKAGSSMKHERLSEYGYELWAECEPLCGIALAYLEARRCRIPPVDGDLRWHASLKHPSGYVGPCLVGFVTDAATGEAMSLHRTWIKPNGRKADLDAPRLLLSGHRKKGGVIRLWPDECVTDGLGIAEGIETALSLAWGFAPTWACIDAGNLAAFPVLPGIKSLLIGADNDPAGIAAARECGLRWSNAGADACMTRQAANDLNDMLTEAA